VYDGITLSKASAKIPTAPLGSALLGAQPTGLAVNPNTNRVYVAGMTSPTSLDVLDASTYQLVASIPGLPDQSRDYQVVAFNILPLPRAIAINTATNRIYVVNSVSSTITVIDGNTNTVTGTLSVAVPPGTAISQPAAAGAMDLKPGNTYYDASTGMVSTLGGAVAAVVDEAANQLYVAGVNGSVSVFALDPSAAPAAFSVNGVIRTPQGTGAVGVTVNATGPAGTASAATDATGMFVLPGLHTLRRARGPWE
jgi:YVTN family beta-propeller protein